VGTGAADAGDTEFARRAAEVDAGLGDAMTIDDYRARAGTPGHPRALMRLRIPHLAVPESMARAMHTSLLDCCDFLLRSDKSGFTLLSK
jgi:hypothetical protein